LIDVDHILCNEVAARIAVGLSAGLKREYRTKKLGAVATIFASIACALVNLPIVYQHTRHSRLLENYALRRGLLFY
jgi:hypothetical protein